MGVDRKGFVTQLLHGQGKSLLRYLALRVRNPADAQDIAQETYLRLLQLGRIDVIRDPQAYLFRVATNVAREHHLRQMRMPLDIRESADVLFEDDVTVEDLVDSDARIERMQAVLAKLEPRHRAVLLLHRRDGMTYEEIAKALGISFHTVKKYLGIALAQCRCALQED